MFVVHRLRVNMDVGCEGANAEYSCAAAVFTLPLLRELSVSPSNTSLAIYERVVRVGRSSTSQLPSP